MSLSMKIDHIFRREGVTPQKVADAADVHLSTAYRWRDGTALEWVHITRLHARGIITDDDLRAAGLSLSRPAAES